MTEQQRPNAFKRSPHLAKELWDQEHSLVVLRRDEAKARESRPPNDEHVVGLALSGGGIRSATLSLGVLQGLARHQLLRRIDYLATVSGGGYVGAFLGGLFERWKRPESDEKREAAFQRVEEALCDAKGHPIDWLRENGRYLAPNGAGGLALAGAIAIRNSPMTPSACFRTSLRACVRCGRRWGAGSRSPALRSAPASVRARARGCRSCWAC